MSDPTQQQDHAMTWLKIAISWIAGAWGNFQLTGFLQNFVLILTAAFTILQIYIQYRDKIIRERDRKQNLGKEVP